MRIIVSRREMSSRRIGGSLCRGKRMLGDNPSLHRYVIVRQPGPRVRLRAGGSPSLRSLRAIDEHPEPELRADHPPDQVATVRLSRHVPTDQRSHLGYPPETAFPKLPAPGNVLNHGGQGSPGPLVFGHPETDLAMGS